MSRSKAFFINGGAGRMIASIPAFELYEKESDDKDSSVGDPEVQTIIQKYKTIREQMIQALACHDHLEVLLCKMAE